MFNLFKSNNKIPVFEQLDAYASANKYFRRIAAWSWHDKRMIFVIDNHAPRLITMDPWPQKIFLAADGQKTILEYVNEVAGEYRSKVPERLDQTIIHEIETLLEEKIIELLDTKRRPEQPHDQPKEFSKRG